MPCPKRPLFTPDHLADDLDGRARVLAGKLETLSVGLGLGVTVAFRSEGDQMALDLAWLAEHWLFEKTGAKRYPNT